jgi:hypothetical protein
VAAVGCDLEGHGYGCERWGALHNTTLFEAVLPPLQ